MAEERARDGFFLGNVIHAGDAVPADPVGRAGKKLRIIRENGRKTLSNLLIYAILLCNIVAAFMGGIILPDGFVHNCILAACISIGIQALSIYGSKLLFRRYPANQKSVLSYGMICSNSSFVGLPIAHLMFGDLGVI